MAEKKETPPPAPVQLDLAGLSYAELQKVLLEAQAQVEIKRKEALTNALEACKAAAQAHGFTLDDVVAHYKPFTVQAAPAGEAETKGKRSTFGKTVAPKYRDPSNPDNTWTGRGRTPKWLEERIATGAKLDEFLIPAE